jgi:hypothetical protein
MRRKVLQDVANTLCHMLVGWRMSEDLEALSQLPDGALSFDVLSGSVVCNQRGPLDLYIAGELSAWLKHRLASLNIPLNAITSATLRAEFTTGRIKTDRKRIVSFDWSCESSVATDEKTYVGRLVEAHQWHTRTAWQSPRSPVT